MANSFGFQYLYFRDFSMAIDHLSFEYLLETSKNNVIDVFFKPLLQNSKLYYRGVGYFSSSWIGHNCEGLIDFASNDGTIRWITSPILNENDLDAIILGEQAKSDILLKTRLEESIQDFERTIKTETLVALAWMIADGIAEFKLAIPCKNLKGEFHDKFGYFEDENGNALCFQGSNNESENGIFNNYESFTIFTSWDESLKIKKIPSLEKKRFLEIWNGENEYLKVYDIPQSIKEKIIKLRKDFSRPYNKPYRLSTLENNDPRIPSKYNELRDYQKQAFQNWKKKQFKGIFSMATGTGKTVTALYCGLQEYLLRKNQNNESFYQIIILVPTQTLVDQWENEVIEFRFRNIIKAYSGNNNWKNQLKKIIDDEKFLGLKKDFVIISTYISFINKFSSLFSKLSENVLLIADEVHNAGSPQFLLLIDNIKYNKRIGLSATPKRIYDSVSSVKVEDFFDSHYPYTFSYSMKTAIENNILSEYYYFPEFINLTTEEFQEYCRLTREIGLSSNLFNNNNEIVFSEKQKKLLLQRKRLINTAENKKVCLINIFNKIGQSNIKHCLVYAPGGKDYFNSNIDLGEERIISQLQQTVNAHFPDISQNRYLGETDDRQDIICGFQNGEIDVLFAINCLDEGVDIPITKYGIFTSSTGNPRQFIQRRGRLLRKHPDKIYAYIYDMIVLPPKTLETFEIEKRLILNELSRVKYFLELSNNYYDFELFFDDLCGHYQISYSEIKTDQEFM